MMKRNVVVTGGCGFIGSNFIKLALKRNAFINIYNIDKQTYAGRGDNLTKLSTCPRYQLLPLDICDMDGLSACFKELPFINAIINFAAESHVDRSIESPDDFVSTNVMGTLNLLEICKRFRVTKFIQISTDEVYGDLPLKTLFKRRFSENASLKPNNPYAASKAAADLLCRSYLRTHNVPVIITRSTNNFGPFQHPEKLIPTIILSIINKEQIPIYGQGNNVRDWIHVQDHCDALLKILRFGKMGEIYNIGANNGQSNIDVAMSVLSHMEAPLNTISFVADRLGHDQRYLLNTNKLYKELHWSPEIDWSTGLFQTINWYQKNEDWWRPLLNSSE